VQLAVNVAEARRLRGLELKSDVVMFLENTAPEIAYVLAGGEPSGGRDMSFVWKILLENNLIAAMGGGGNAAE